MEHSIQIELEKATREDFILSNRVQYGELYYLESQESGKFHGPYTLKADSENLNKFKSWLSADMVWIQKRRT